MVKWQKLVHLWSFQEKGFDLRSNLHIINLYNKSILKFLLEFAIRIAK